MRKITEKISIVAQVCITLIFVVTTLLYITGVIPSNDGVIDNGVFVSLLVILAITYGLLSAYMIYINFSEGENLRQILLFCDSESATHASVRVVRNIVKSCSKQVEGIRVRKVKMRLDEKQGLAITVKINVSTHKVSESVDKLRCLLADAFRNTLGVTFNSINFVIRRLKSSYKPDVEKAEKMAKTLTEQRELSADIYEQPYKDNCKACAAKDEQDEKSGESNNDDETEQDDTTSTDDDTEQQ